RLVHPGVELRPAQPVAPGDQSRVGPAPGGGAADQVGDVARFGGRSDHVGSLAHSRNTVVWVTRGVGGECRAERENPTSLATFSILLSHAAADLPPGRIRGV